MPATERETALFNALAALVSDDHLPGCPNVNSEPREARYCATCTSAKMEAAKAIVAEGQPA